MTMKFLNDNFEDNEVNELSGEYINNKYNSQGNIQIEEAEQYLDVDIIILCKMIYLF